MQRRRFGAGLKAGWLMAFLLLGASAAPAQQAVRPMPFEVSGSVKQIGPFLQVVADNDDIWNLRFPPNIVPGEDIHVLGEADAEWLQPGMMVRITAKINTKKGAFLEPIKSLEVITVRPENEPGLINEDEPKLGDDLFTDPDPKQKKRPKPTKLPEEINATMIGDIGSIKAGKITIRVPGFKSVKGELSEKCKISVDMANPAMIRVGDKVTVKGEYYAAEKPNGGAPGFGTIKTIEVQAAEKFEPIKPLKRGQQPGGYGKPGEEGKEGGSGKKGEDKQAEKADTKGATAKRGVAPKKP